MAIRVRHLQRRSAAGSVRVPDAIRLVTMAVMLLATLGIWEY